MKLKKLFFTLILTLLYVGISFAQGTIHYVTTTGSGTKSGDSWANASDDIQSMITTSVDGDEIWIAAGLYNRENYSINKKLSLYGGFASDENYLNQRDYVNNVTILSADFFFDIWSPCTLDGFTIKTYCSVKSSSILSNLVITEGELDIMSSTIIDNITVNNCGTGILIANASAIINNATITNNSVGIVCLQSSEARNIPSKIILTNSTISNNNTGISQQQSMGYYLPSLEVSELTNVVMSGNGVALSSNDKAGGFKLSNVKISDGGNGINITGFAEVYGETWQGYGNLFMDSCEISNNTGWGINIANAKAELNHVVINNNGGGIQQSNIQIRDPKPLCVFNDVTITNNKNSGGISFDYNNYIISNSLISGNTSTNPLYYEAGGISNFSTTAKIINTTISKNKCTIRGDMGTGGIIFIDSPITLEDVLIEENEGTEVGGINDARSEGESSYKRVTFRNNKAGPFRYGGTLAGKISGTLEEVICDGNTSSDYGFVMQGGGSIENCKFINNKLQPGSILIGSFSSIKNSEFANNICGEGGAVIGLSLNDGESNLSSLNIHDNIGTGLAISGYLNIPSFNVQNSIIKNNQSASEAGGIFISSGNVAINNTPITDCSSTSDGGGVYISGGNVAISDLTISNNTAGGSGGGIFISGGIPTLKNLTVTNNTAGGNGGGIFETTNSFSMEGLTISNNKSTGSGGGMYSDIVEENDQLGTIKGCVFQNNEASGNGGGILLGIMSGIVQIENSSFLSNKAANGGGISKEEFQGKFYTEVKNCKISGNTALNDGGGINIGSQGVFVLNNSSVYGNKAGNNGGGMSFGIWSDQYYIVNTTISGNNASTGGGIYDPYRRFLVINNSILTGNGNSNYASESSGTEITSASNCLIGNMNPNGSDNINDALGIINPQFVNPVDASSAPTVDGDYTLIASSPLINKGNNNFLSYKINYMGQRGERLEYLCNIDKDLNNNPRIYNNGAVDIGAYEYQGDAVTVLIPVTGISLNKTESNLDYPETMQLTALIQPTYASNIHVNWSSSDENVATVSPYGLVTAKSAGTVTITGTTEDGNFSAFCVVTVIETYSVTLPDNIWARLGTYSLPYLDAKVNPLPQNSETFPVLWESSNPDVVGITSSIDKFACFLQPNSIGEAVITVKIPSSSVSDSYISASCNVTVTIDSLKINDETLSDGIVGKEYDHYFTTLGGDISYKWYIFSNTLPNGLSLSETGHLSGIPTEAGTFDFGVAVSNYAEVIGVNFFSLTILKPSVVTAPTITTTSLPNGTRGVYYSAKLEATGTDVHWSGVSGLDFGLSLSDDGTISGTPQLSGNFTFIAHAQNDAGQDEKEISIVINEPPIAPTITTTSLPNGKVGTAYSAQLSATGDTPVTWSQAGGMFPDGLDINNETGEIVGIPTTKGIFSFDINALNSAGNDMKGFTIEIQDNGTSIEAINNPLVKVYVKEKSLIVESESLIKSVEIVNIAGQILKKVDAGSSYIRISGLPRDQVLIVVITPQTGNIIRKTIVF